MILRNPCRLRVCNVLNNLSVVGWVFLGHFFLHFLSYTNLDSVIGGLHCLSIKRGAGTPDGFGQELGVIFPFHPFCNFSPCAVCTAYLFPTRFVLRGPVSSVKREAKFALFSSFITTFCIHKAGYTVVGGLHWLFYWERCRNSQWLWTRIRGQDFLFTPFVISHSVLLPLPLYHFPLASF